MMLLRSRIYLSFAGLVLLFTQTLSAQTFTSTDTPIGIPEDGIITSTINVGDSFSIGDLNVNLDYNHTFNSDLIISVQSPTGTSVTLSNTVGEGRDAQSGGYLFDDEATDPWPPGGNPIPLGTYQPNEPLSAFDGENAQGDWTLTVNDTVFFDSGTLNLWQLLFTVPNDTTGSDTLASLSAGELQGNSEFLSMLAGRLRGMRGVSPTGNTQTTYRVSRRQPKSDIQLVSTFPQDQDASAPVLTRSYRRTTKRTRAWVSGYGADGNIDTGYDYNFGGVAFGLERDPDCQTTLGLAGNYFGANGDGSSAHTDLDAYGFAAYFNRQFGNSTYLTGILGYSHGAYDTSRSTLTGTALGDTNSNSFLSLLELGKTYRNCGWIIQPHTSFQYIGLLVDEYTETGAGASNLIVGEDHVDSARGSLGLSIARSLPLYCGATFSPFTRVAYTHEFVDDNQIIGAGFGGAGSPFTIRGAQLGRNFADLTAGFQIAGPSGLAVFGSCDLQLSSQHDQQSGMGGISYSW